MEHDFKANPELRNNQMADLYMDSPHKQIFNNFEATIIKVHDGDTVTIQTDFRDFNFPLRVFGIDAPELNMDGGHEARDYLKNIIEGQLVQIIMNPNQRVEKWGRLLGDILFKGIKVSEDMILAGHAWPFDQRREGMIPRIDELFNDKWLMT